MVRSATLRKKELFHCVYSRRVLSLREKRTVTCSNRLFFATFFTLSFLFSTYSKDLGLETAQIAPTDYFYRTVITQGMSHKILQALRVLRRLARRQIGAIKNENRRKNIALIFIDTLLAYSDVFVFSKCIVLDQDHHLNVGKSYSRVLIFGACSRCFTFLGRL